MTELLFCKPLGYLFLCLVNAKSVEKAGVGHNARCAVCKGFLFNIAALDDLDYRKSEFLGKLPVARIVTRNRHDCAGAVACKNIIGNEDRDLRACYGVDSSNALKSHTGLILLKLGALKVRLSRRRRLIFTHRVKVFKLISPLFN